MGYPDDWSLTWSKGDTPLTGHMTNASSSGERYMYTSMLPCIPIREDNGNIIKCTAQKESWTTSQDGSLGPFDVQCKLSVVVTKKMYNALSIL